MKMPKAMKVQGTKIKIKYLDKVFDSDGNESSGTYDPETRVIEIEGKSPRAKEYLLHELGHAVLDLSGINDMEISDDAKEAIVDNYARFILANFDFK